MDAVAGTSHGSLPRGARLGKPGAWLAGMATIAAMLLIKPVNSAGHGAW